MIQKSTLLWWFYAVALALVLGVSVFGGYLLSRDVEREMQTTEERSNFIAGVSHELRTPLAAIRMYAETLAMGRMTDEKARHEYAEIILAESERLGRLVDNVLDFAKIEQGKKRGYRLRPTNVAEVIRTAVRALERPLAQQGFELDMKLDETVPDINAAKIKVTGDTASVLFAASPTPTTMVRVDGEWKISVKTIAQQLRSRPRDYRNALAKLTTATNTIAEKIRDGQYPNPDAAKKDLESASKTTFGGE